MVGLPSARQCKVSLICGTLSAASYLTESCLQCQYRACICHVCYLAVGKLLSVVMQTIAEREQRYQEELAEQAKEVDRLAARKVCVCQHKFWPSCVTYDATALPPAQPIELVKAACLWLFLHCRPHRQIEAKTTLHHLYLLSFVAR